MLARDTRLRWFLLVSFCLYVGMLRQWTLPIDLNLSGHRETFLSVSLTPGPRIETRPKDNNQVAPGQPTRPVPALEPQPVTKSPAPSTATLPNAADTTLTKDATDTTDAEASNAGQQGLARAQVEAKLSADLKRYFEYPPLARREGWQGTVWLSFIVEPDGRLTQIHVAQSSGYDVLDKSAINALHRVGRLTEANHWLLGRPRELRVSISYRLVDR